MDRIFILEWVHQGNESKWFKKTKQKNKDRWTEGQERHKDRGVMLISSYRYTTGRVASVDPWHNSSVFILLPQRDFYSLSPPIYPDVTRCPYHPRSFFFFTQEVQTAAWSLRSQHPHSHHTDNKNKSLTKPHKDTIRSTQIRSDQIKSNQIRSLPTRLLSIGGKGGFTFEFLTSLLFSVWSSILHGGKKNPPAIKTRWHPREKQWINEESFLFERLFQASRFGKVVHKQRACANANAPSLQSEESCSHVRITVTTSEIPQFTAID